MKAKTQLKLRNTTSNAAKFRTNDYAYLSRAYADDSKTLRDHVGQIGTVIGYRDYYNGKGGPGNRYYVMFDDGVTIGIESMLLRRVKVETKLTVI
jgi:hypothetical protein